jgi:dTMP kinase
MLLYMAARAQLVDEVIRPALDSAKVVVSDRYLLANIAYQGYGAGLGPDAVREIGRFVTAGVLPDCVFLLDMPPAAATRRLNRPLDRMETKGNDYRERIRNGFLAEAARETRRIHVIDASRTIEAVQAEIWKIAGELLA